MTAERGIARSAAHAGSEWVESAVHYVAWYCRTARGKIAVSTVEEIREWATAKGLPDPPDRRAWGSAARAAIRQGIIAPTGGYAPARSSHGSGKRLYRRGQG